jgi:hypothetical protein
MSLKVVVGIVPLLALIAGCAKRSSPESESGFGVRFMVVPEGQPARLDNDLSLRVMPDGGLLDELGHIVGSDGLAGALADPAGGPLPAKLHLHLVAERATEVRALEKAFLTITRGAGGHRQVLVYLHLHGLADEAPPDPM